MNIARSNKIVTGKLKFLAIIIAVGVVLTAGSILLVGLSRRDVAKWDRTMRELSKLKKGLDILAQRPEAVPPPTLDAALYAIHTDSDPSIVNDSDMQRMPLVTKGVDAWGRSLLYQVKRNVVTIKSMGSDGIEDNGGKDCIEIIVFFPNMK